MKLFMRSQLREACLQKWGNMDEVGPASRHEKKANKVHVQLVSAYGLVLRRGAGNSWRRSASGGGRRPLILE